MEILTDLLKCQICQKTLCGNPLLLNCCEATICSSHIEENIEQTYECPLCLFSHNMRNKKFATNKVVENLLKLKLDQLKFGKAFQDMNQELGKLKKSITDLSDLSKDPNNYVFEYVADLKSEVDKRREEMKIQIDEMSDAMIKRLEAFQDKCYKNIKGSEIQKTVANTQKLAQETREKLDAWSNETKCLIIDESKWAEIQTKTKSLDIELHGAMSEFKSDLLFDKKWIHTNKHFVDFKNDFNDQLIEFDEKNTIEFKLDNFSKVFNQKEEFKRINSKAYSFDDSTQWYISSQKVSNSLSLGTFLYIKSTVFPVLTDFKLTISNLIDSRKNLSKSGIFCFKENTGRGFKHFLSFKDIMDPENGYYDVANDQVTVKAEFHYKVLEKIEP